MDLAGQVRNADLPDSLRSDLVDHFRRSQSASDPAFPIGIEQSTPLDSAPYVIDWMNFETAFGRCDPRRQRMAVLASACQSLLKHRVEPQFILVGGSHIDLTQEQPRDLDCVLFYRMGDDADLPPDFLARMQHSLKRYSVDVRLVPVDGPPILTAKMIGYFTLLYSRDRQIDQAKPMLLVEPPQ